MTESEDARKTDKVESAHQQVGDTTTTASSIIRNRYWRLATILAIAIFAVFAWILVFRNEGNVNSGRAVLLLGIVGIFALSVLFFKYLGNEVETNSSVGAGEADGHSPKTHSVAAVFSIARQRLVNEVSTLARRGHVNLFIGSGTSVVAVSIIVWTVYAPAVQLAPPSNMTSRFDGLYTILPSVVLRVPLAIFIEVFSFFFLRLYRQGLNDIKYFQNEITNLECKYLGIRMARMDKAGISVVNVIGELMKTERNFVLKKGEMTIDSERLRAEDEALLKALEAVTKVTEKAVDKIK